MLGVSFPTSLTPWWIHCAGRLKWTGLRIHYPWGISLRLIHFAIVDFVHLYKECTAIMATFALPDESIQYTANELLDTWFILSVQHGEPFPLVRDGLALARYHSTACLRLMNIPYIVAPAPLSKSNTIHSEARSTELLPRQATMLYRMDLHLLTPKILQHIPSLTIHPIRTNYTSRSIK